MRKNYGDDRLILGGRKVLKMLLLSGTFSWANWRYLQSRDTAASFQYVSDHSSE